MNPSAGFIRRPVATALLAVAMLLLGVVAYPLLPVAPLPQVDFPTIQVSASLPGASPETMASNVATPLERQFSLIPGLDQMTSTSALGSAQITLQFNLTRNIDAAATDVQAAINAAGGQLPTNLPSPPTYRKVNPADAPILVMSLTSATLPLTQVNDYADNILAQQLSQIDGVGLVQLSGTQKPAVRIQIDPARLSSLGLGLEDVRASIAATTANAPKGTFDGTSQSFTVYDNDQILAAAPWNDVIVAYRGGAPIRVRDIGTAVDGPENTKLAAWAYTDARTADGPAPRAIVLAISKLPGANVIETVDRVKAALPRLQGAIPPSVEVTVLTDRTQTIRASVADVQFTLMLTIALVVMVIFVFLRNLAATVIPSLTVPLALAGTAAVMYAAGFSLDNLSLMALTVAVGFVVDDAIVVLENIYRYVEGGMPVREAALKGAGEIGFTVIAISVSLVAVFIPFLLMGGIVGRLLREFALTVSITIALSVVVSLTLTPMLCSRFLRDTTHDEHGKFYQLCERGFDWLLDRYAAGLQFVLRHQFVTLLSFFATLGLTVFLFIAIPKGFFPQQDTGFLFGQAVGPEDSSSAQMAGRMTALGEVIKGDPDVGSLAFNVGATSFNQGNFYVNLRPQADGRTATADETIARLRPKAAQVPGVTLFLQALQDIRVGGRLSRMQYQYTRHHDGRCGAAPGAERGQAAARGDLRGLQAAVAPDPDDDDVRPVGRGAVDAGHRHRVGVAAAPGVRDGGRADRVPGADAVHDAGGVFVSRPGECLAVRRAWGEGREAGSRGAGGVGRPFSGPIIEVSVYPLFTQGWRTLSGMAARLRPGQDWRSEHGQQCQGHPGAAAPSCRCPRHGYLVTMTSNDLMTAVASSPTAGASSPMASLVIEAWTVTPLPMWTWPVVCPFTTDVTRPLIWLRVLGFIVCASSWMRGRGSW